MTAAGDKDLRVWLCDDPFPPLASVSDSRPNWETLGAFSDMTAAIKTVARRGTDSHLRATIMRFAETLVIDAYTYNYDDLETVSDVIRAVGEDRIHFETLGTASGTIVPRFLRAAVSEIHAGNDVGGEVMREDNADAPTPDSGKSWEKAGWDVVVRTDKNEYTTYQVKATANKPSGSKAKEADKIYWLPCEQGEFKFDKAKVIEV